MKSYEIYCKAHPEFENHKTVEAVEIIKNAYHKCLQERKFL